MNPFLNSLLPLILATAVSFSAEHEKAGHEHDEKAEGGEAHAEEEANPGVGPEKGILSADEHEGFKLSPEAIKSFELQHQKLNGPSPWKLPRTALLLAGEERNIYRVREGNYKRIDFKVLKDAPDSMTIESSDLKTGDEVVIKGLGFLRIAELSAFGGAPEGHSH
jgi:hypothetical protein